MSDPGRGRIPSSALPKAIIRANKKKARTGKQHARHHPLCRNTIAIHTMFSLYPIHPLGVLHHFLCTPPFECFSTYSPCPHPFFSLFLGLPHFPFGNSSGYDYHFGSDLGRGSWCVEDLIMEVGVELTGASSRLGWVISRQAIGSTWPMLQETR